MRLGLRYCPTHGWLKTERFGVNGCEKCWRGTDTAKRAAADRARKAANCRRWRAAKRAGRQAGARIVPILESVRA